MPRILSLIALWSLLVTGCASFDIPAERCPAGTQALPNCPPLEAVQDAALDRWYDQRQWLPASERDQDLVQTGIEAEIPVQKARAKILATNERDALYSLAAKLHMIEQARHSIDAVYYIFRDDLAGRAMLGALCEAVERGVDVRLMVDSLGSISFDKNLLRALYSCQWNAGFVPTGNGAISTRRARIQVVIFNALSALKANPNRRSHDKLMVVDGFVPDRAIVITGGRNISLDYYGIEADGTPNPDTYMDAELLLRPVPGDEQEYTVSEAAEIYFSLLAGFKGNKHLQTRVAISGREGYAASRLLLKDSLREIRTLPRLAQALAAMPDYLSSGFAEVEVLLAHEFGNLVNSAVVSRALENQDSNPNSIMGVMASVDTRDDKNIKLVSPYLFIAKYRDATGEVVLDEAEMFWQWLEEDPERSLDIITNSVLTSDNFFAQAYVDMDMAPRMLLDAAHKEAWRASRRESELNPELVDSEAWLRLVNSPRVRLYETGRGDDRRIGGEQTYGKLHAKYLLTDEVGFLGTANFDYRSRLFNNEMGFFFRGEALHHYLVEDFERLRGMSYRWGTPEWLEMRRRLVEAGGPKGLTTKYQRALYRLLKSTGLYWLF